jgi:erythromycin esterase
MITAELNEKDFQVLRTSRDLDALLDRIGDARYVLLGEASHGTHEYYTWRTAITKRLIEEKNFSFIAVEGDWPDCYRINRFIKGYHTDGEKIVDVLKSFQRWPTWMWSNWEIAALIEWMHEHNKHLTSQRKIGFYGLDVYSLQESMEVMVDYLKKEDPHAAQLAIEAFRCFEPYGEGQDYARAMLQLSANCRQEVLKLLTEIRRRSRHYDHDVEAALNAEMNAQVVASAEKYYRSMVSFRDESWNVRDSHMVETLNALMKYHGNKAKAIVWEHNTHVGDARYTDMHEDGLLNVGQLVRQQHEKDGVFIIGFGCFQGTVIAARIWGGTMEKMRVPPAIDGSAEALLHQQSGADRIIFFRSQPASPLHTWLGHRAIGVVYQPEYEKGNYVSSFLPSRYDALVYIDQSKALHPLHVATDTSQMPDTYPFGF